MKHGKICKALLGALLAKAFVRFHISRSIAVMF